MNTKIMNNIKYDTFNFNKESIWYLNELKEDIIKESLDSINEFKNPDYMKFQDLTILEILLSNTSNIDCNLIEDILFSLIKNLFKFDEKEFVLKILNISYILGKNNDSELLISLVSKYIKKEINNNSFKTLSNILKIGSKILENCIFVKIVNECIMIFKDLESIISLDKEITMCSSLFLKSLIQISDNSIKNNLDEIFPFILNLQSNLNILNKTELLDETLLNLSNKCGYSCLSNLYKENIDKILNDYYMNKSYENWDKNSLDRFKFEVIVKNSKDNILDYFEIILIIIAENVKPDKDYEIKFDMISLYQYIISFPALINSLKEKKFFILENILINVLVWRMNTPNMKVRKAGVILFIESIEKNILDNECLEKLFDKYLPVIKNCLSDSYAPDLRFATIKLCKNILDNSELSHIHLSDLYPILLERLDDSQDEVRIEASNSLSSYIRSKNHNISDSTLEYLTESFFIHLDDQNEKLQLSMYKLILEFSQINSSLVLSHAKVKLPQMRFQRLCEDIIKQLENNN